MKRTMFGDPRPLGAAEIIEALNEKYLDADYVTAVVSYESESDGFDGKGWTAEISGEPDEDSDLVIISTLAYPEKDTLLADLAAVGINDVEEE